MICLICRQAALVNGFTAVTLERAEIELTAKNVPALICPSCGDASVSEDVAMWLLSNAEQLVKTGVRESIYKYGATGD
ncbi:MAG: type II toxin-antitoxin system MqsA family antitoxin [Anaerolineales bacterium]